MKKIILIVAGFLIMHIASAQQKVQQYAIKSGYVEYTLSGNTTGVKKIWWDNYGEKSRTETQSETVTKIFGIKNVDKTHSLEILVKDKYWTANLADQSGHKGTLPYYKESRQYVESMTEKEQEEFANQTISSLGGERLKSENFMGKTCDVIKVMGAKIWIHKGIPLKSEAQILGMVINETAVKFQANQAVSASKFKPLSNISYEDIDQQQQSMFGDMSAMETMEAMQNRDMDDSDNDNIQMIPVKYPYDKFLKKVNAFSYEGYKKMMVQSADGMHNAAFMKGFGTVLGIAAISRKNGDISKEGSFENFTHKGKKCMYGNVDENNGDDEDESMLLILEIPQYDTYITIGSTPPQTKYEMLEILDLLDF
ncbi:hypothetical protein ACXR6G_15530 [Ancylomarina sp. YFZ004]